MNELKFASGPATTLAIAQSNNSLAATIRYADERGISEGDTISVHSSHTGKQLGTAEVTHTEPQPVRRALNVVDAHWAEYGIQTPARLVTELNKYYDDIITAETEVKVIILNPGLHSVEDVLERPRRLKHFKFSAQVLRHVLRDGNTLEVVDGVPEGSQLNDFGYDPQSQVFYLTVEHESFDPIHEGEEIPTGTVELQTLDPDE